MDLRSDHPFWLLKNGIVAAYPSLQDDVKTDVAIIGAGISGALAAWHLANAGFQVTVTDRRHVGMGSTAASTALLQYEIDTPLRELIGKVGEKHAVASYKLCEQSIYDLEAISKKLGKAVGFERKESLQYASFKSHIPDLKKELDLRRKHGMKLKWLEAADILSGWGFEAPGGILSESGGQVDPYRLTHELLLDSISKEVQIYDSTEITAIEHLKTGVKLHAANGRTIKAKYLVIAAGYESGKYIEKKIEQFSSTYAIISEPFENGYFWQNNSLIWETASPYLYLRTTPDKRIIIGGKDDTSSDPRKRAANLKRKARELKQAFSEKFPHLPFKTDFQWAGVFAGTKDGLPYIGSIPEHPNTFFALGFGGNGMTYSLIAAQLITAALQGKKREGMEIFRFDR